MDDLVIVSLGARRVELDCAGPPPLAWVPSLFGSQCLAPPTLPAGLAPDIVTLPTRNDLYLYTRPCFAWARCCYFYLLEKAEMDAAVDLFLDESRVVLERMLIAVLQNQIALRIDQVKHPEPCRESFPDLRARKADRRTRCRTSPCR